MTKDIPDPVVGDWAPELQETKSLIYDAVIGNLDRKMLKKSRAAYYALIAHIDAQIGRFLQALYDYGVLDNTAIVFTSDHGELLGDHHLFRKCLPFNGSARVPFLIKLPQEYKSGKNREIDALCELRDLMPTVLDIAGVKIPDSVDGRSILPLISGRKKSIRNFLHGEHLFSKNSNHYIVTEDNLKYIWFSQTGRELFFDLNGDPHELKDLSKTAGYKKRMETCRKLLIKELAGREECYTDGKKLFKGRGHKAALNKLLK
jgi:arylsulfatase A-like enzyme